MGDNILVDTLQETVSQIKSGALDDFINKETGSIQLLSFKIRNSTFTENILLPALVNAEKSAGDNAKLGWEPKNILISEDKPIGYNKNTDTLTININEVKDLPKDELIKKVSESVKSVHEKIKEKTIFEKFKEWTLSDNTPSSDNNPLTPTPIYSASLQNKQNRTV